MTAARLRINKALAQAGVASRREADALIRRGDVRLNGAVAEPGATMVPGEDLLEVHGRPVSVPTAQPPELWALYKPKRCVSTLRDPEGRPSLADLLPKAAAGRLFPIGRLDYDAEGLILLTNDGELANRVAHPSFGIEKVYLVKVKGLVQPETLRRLGRGPLLEGRRRQHVRARILHTHNDKTWLEVTLREGIQHHIKKMFAAEGHRVLKIKRYQVGPVELGELEPGHARKLGRAEIDALLGRGPRSRPRAAHG